MGLPQDPTHKSQGQLKIMLGHLFLKCCEGREIALGGEPPGSNLSSATFSSMTLAKSPAFSKLKFLNGNRELI